MTVTHALPLLTGGVWALNEVTEIAAITKLIRAPQYRPFKAFSIYLVADVIRSVVLWWFSAASISSRLYADIWLRSEPLLLALQGIAVVELYIRLYRAYPGIGRFGRVLVLAALFASISLCLFTVGMDLREQWKHPDLQMMMLAKRLLSSVASALLALTLAFFPPARSARLIFEIGWLLSALLGAAAIGYFLIDVTAQTHNNSVEIGTIVLAVQSAVLIWWIFKALPLETTQSSARSTSDYEWNELLKLARWLRK